MPLADATLVRVPEGVSDEEALLLGDILVRVGPQVCVFVLLGDILARARAPVAAAPALPCHVPAPRPVVPALPAPALAPPTFTHTHNCALVPSIPP